MPRVLMTESDIDRSLTRIAHEILEKNDGAERVVVLGIATRGIPLAARIASKIRGVEGEVESGTLDVTAYRDDLYAHPTRSIGRSDVPDIDGKIVVLVDDVLYSGRTIRAALDALVDIGRPARVQLAVLVDRGHRDLPIRADFVGKNIPTDREERVSVHVNEIDGEDVVTIDGGRR